MRKLNADVVVVGGGSTGTGVVRDAAMRGYRAILVERADLAQGTSGRFHGLLHSGGRYVVADPLSAAECAAENAVISRIQPAAVERTGGLFIVGPGDDPDFGDVFLAGAKAAQVPAEEISPGAALRLEPRLDPKLRRAFQVLDGTVDGWQLVWSAAASARLWGGQILTYTEIVEIIRGSEGVRGVRAVDRKTGEAIEIECGFLINCAGPWAGRVATLAGVRPVEVVPGRGVMVAMAHRLVNRVVNRCAKPADGDILVPVHTVCVIGTTDVKVADPDNLAIPRAEVRQMLEAGEALIPGFQQARALHAWAGARPLVKDDRVDDSDTRHMSRGMAVIDHAARDGVAGLVTVGGGKLTTYRLMAQHAVDAMENQTGRRHPCRTADEICPGQTPGRNYLVSCRLQEREADRLDDQIICECELVSRRALLGLWDEFPQASLDDLRRQSRLGMGPCQGGFCSARAAGLACATGKADGAQATGLLRDFLANRWLGLAPVLYGDQVRQTALDYWIFQGALDVDHLPAAPNRPAEPPAAEDQGSPPTRRQASLACSAGPAVAGEGVSL
ncbi:MAG: anaerobic glycerol-3-phosphate dehydrogenase subunit A [Propionibacteriaceae bacterium]|jgi:glycerol-3-phosphate dehydrogenase|nr:anaerobic glycerol-3-phosphate dehydrogenase subunit A [Propionibacteriaceae bacterium]